MSDVAIRAEGLSKLYRIGRARPRYHTLRDRLSETMSSPFRWIRSAVNRNPRGNGNSRDTVWALKDVSLEVKRGEVLGVIGRNGAGKTTLLKILSRITEPTRGCAEVRGRVGSLLEVGTGFHPELTGRENIYLNGAILGMRKAEIDSRFEAVIHFAEIEPFLDTAVKHYSSGMYMRLAFSVAAHLDTEVLMVDEVLAVGDAAFQQKCLTKMDEVAREGRTVVFVTHNLRALERLSGRCVLLDQGALVASGATADILGLYLSSAWSVVHERTWSDIARAPGDRVVRLEVAKVVQTGKGPDARFDIDQPIDVVIEYQKLEQHPNVSVGLHLWNIEGVHLFTSHDFVGEHGQRQAQARGKVTAVCRIPAHLLAEGRFLVHVSVSSFTPTLLHHAVVYEALSFEVVDQTQGEGVRGMTSGVWPGVVRPMLHWTLSSAAVRELRPSGTSFE